MTKSTPAVTLITDASLFCAGVAGWAAWARADGRDSRSWDGQITQTWVRTSGEAELATIARWCEETFGPITPERMVERAGEEFEELRAEPTSAEEAADVVICLARVPGLWDAVQRKMAKNRLRRWNLRGDGTGYHVKGT